jgi:hypothetical protein
MSLRHFRANVIQTFAILGRAVSRPCGRARSVNRLSAEIDRAVWAEIGELFPCDCKNDDHDYGTGNHHWRSCPRGIFVWLSSEIAKPREERKTYDGRPLA